MLIGHMPFGYLLSYWLRPVMRPGLLTKPLFIAAGVLGSTAPDVDMLYFHFIDAGQHNHHSYWTHFPLVWIALLIAAVGFYRWRRSSPAAVVALVFCLNGFLHLVLDSFIGDIRWLAPWSQQAFSLFEVQARWPIWWLNYVLHWFFAVELALVIGAITLWRRNRRSGVFAMGQSVQGVI